MTAALDEASIRSRMDRARFGAFARFTWRRFIDDRLLGVAGALAYTTVFALVPLTTAVLGVLAGFPALARFRDKVVTFIFTNFVPASGQAVQDYITQFADNASQATVIGILVLLFSAISLMRSIEDAFNRIWRAQTAPHAATRFLLYWAALSLGPMLLVAAFAVSSYLFALPFIGAYEAQFSFKARVLSVVPFAMVWLALFSAYALIPNRSVKLRHALLGAFVATVLFEGAKRGFAAYVGHVSYEQVYGALAVIPLFLFWIYLSWIIVLLGATLAAALGAFEYLPPALRLPPGQEFVGLLRVLDHFVRAQREGVPLHTRDLREREKFLTDDLLARYLADMRGIGLINRTEHGEWVVVRDPATVNLVDLYEIGNYRLPLRVVGDDDVARRVAPLIESLREGLGRSLSELLPSREVARVAAIQEPK